MMTCDAFEYSVVGTAGVTTAFIMLTTLLQPYNRLLFVSAMKIEQLG